MDHSFKHLVDAVKTLVKHAHYSAGPLDKAELLQHGKNLDAIAFDELPAKQDEKPEPKK